MSDYNAGAARATYELDASPFYREIERIKREYAALRGQSGQQTVIPASQAPAGLKDVTPAQARQVEAAAKLANAQARLQQAQDKSAASAAKLAQSQAQLALADQRTATEAARTATALQNQARAMAQPGGRRGRRQGQGRGHRRGRRHLHEAMAWGGQPGPRLTAA